ncbi:MAG: hypothetical protein NVSMB57_08170 [Actinomycetota bacterium]
MTTMTKPKLRASAYPLVFLTGAVLGTFWNQLLVRPGALRYAHPFIAGQPWWIPLQFGAMLVVGVALFVTLGDPVPKHASPRVAQLEALWLTALFAFAAFFDQHPWVVFAFLAVALVARSGDMLVVLGPNWLPASALLVGFPLLDLMLTRAEVSVYRTSQAGPLPAWTLLLWASWFLFTLRIGEAFLLRFGVRRIVEPAVAVVTPTEVPAVQQVTEDD